MYRNALGVTTVRFNRWRWNPKDSLSNTTYFEAAQQLRALSGAPLLNVPNVAYWDNIFPGLATTAERLTSLYGTTFTRFNPGLAPATALTPTQTAFFLYSQANPGNDTLALQNIDIRCSPACSKFGPFAFFDDQFGSLVAWRSVAPASYHSFQLIARKRLSRGLQLDFNYALSKALDWTSGVERSDPFSGTYIINSFKPEQMRSYSDFDLRHSVNANWIAELPVGRGRWLGGESSRCLMQSSAVGKSRVCFV